MAGFLYMNACKSAVTGFLFMNDCKPAMTEFWYIYLFILQKKNILKVFVFYYFKPVFCSSRHNFITDLVKRDVFITNIIMSRKIKGANKYDYHALISETLTPPEPRDNIGPHLKIISILTGSE